MGFSDGANGKEPTCLTGRHKRHRFDPWVENPMDRGAWQDTVHGIAKSQTRLKQLSTVHSTQHIYLLVPFALCLRF